MDERVKDKDVNEEKTKQILPKVGTKFMVNGVEYKVTYVNEGKSRFTSEPCKGMY